MEKIKIQKQELTLYPLKIRQINDLEGFVKEAVQKMGFDKNAEEVSIMSAVTALADKGLLGDLASILFAGQEAVKKIKWADVDINDLARITDAFLQVNEPAIDALKRLFKSSGLTVDLGN